KKYLPITMSTNNNIHKKMSIKTIPINNNTHKQQYY
ncbi:hypothetical protein YPPY54_1060, partial [Yersinia pestis PY-54]